MRQLDKETIRNMAEALNHCLEYFKAKRPDYCGIDDDRDCSPYQETLKAIIAFNKNIGARVITKTKKTSKAGVK